MPARKVSGMLLAGLLLHNVQQKRSRGSEMSEKKERKLKKRMQQYLAAILSLFTVVIIAGNVTC